MGQSVKAEAPQPPRRTQPDHEPRIDPRPIAQMIRTTTTMIPWHPHRTEQRINPITHRLRIKPIAHRRTARRKQTGLFGIGFGESGVGQLESRK